MRPFFSVSKFSALLLAVGIAAGLYPQTLLAQSNSDQNGLSALVSRQQQRMDLLEGGIKDVRGTIETELQNIRTELETLAASAVASQSGASSDFKSVQGELAKLADNVAIISQRINNTLDLYSDIEFRILRLEKRMTTLLSLSGDDIVEKLAQGEVSAGGSGPSVSMSRDVQTGETVWTIDKEQLDNQLAEDNSSLAASDNNIEAATSTASNTAATDTPPQTATGGESVPTPGQDGQTQQTETAEVEVEAEPVPSILPDASTEDQFRFALTRALQNDLETAEQAFIEFSDLYPDHARSSDALFWLGRVQFIQGQFEKSATTFSKFNALYSTDPRLPDTTLWIAESVSKFAAPAQACDIYDNLGKFLDQPPENFVARLKELSDGANCSS
jgi:TolA-binding protein